LQWFGGFYPEAGAERYLSFCFPAIGLCALQSDYAAGLIDRLGIRDEAPDSIILVEKDRVYYRSRAALRIARRLRRLWPLIYVLVIVPPFIRNPIYDWIAKNRYRWFGKRNTCFVPPKDLSYKFLQ